MKEQAQSNAPAVEQQMLATAVKELLESFPELPKEIQKNGVAFQRLQPDRLCMGFAPVAGAIKTKEYLDGSYDAQFPFQLIYRTMPSTDSERFDRYNLIDRMALWLEGGILEDSAGNSYQLKNYPTLSDDRKITNIAATTLTTLINRSESGYEDYQGLFRVEYHKGE